MPLDSHLYLTGFRGTGKSTVARLLAIRWNCSAIDLDQEICAGEAMTIREIFATAGEARFRDLETHYLRQVAKLSPSVISLGGGTILREANRSLIRSTGTCVWLTAQPTTIQSRLSEDPTTRDNRPALSDAGELDEIVTLLAQRETLYRGAASFSISTDHRSPEEVVEATLKRLNTPR